LRSVARFDNCTVGKNNGNRNDPVSHGAVSVRIRAGASHCDLQGKFWLALDFHALRGRHRCKVKGCSSGTRRTVYYIGTTLEVQVSIMQIVF